MDKKSEILIPYIQTIIQYYTDAISKERALNWLIENEQEWENNYKSIPEVNLKSLKFIARKNIKLRRFLEKYFFDINWIIYDLLNNTNEKNAAVQWINENQNELKNYQDDVDKDSFWNAKKILRSDKKLREYLKQFFFNPSWIVYDLVYGDLSDKIQASTWLKSNEKIWQENIDFLDLHEFIIEAHDEPVAWSFYKEALPQLTNYKKFFFKICSMSGNDIDRTKNSIFLIFPLLQNKNKAWKELVKNIVPILNECQWNGKYHRRPQLFILKEQETWILSIINEIFDHLENKIEGFKAFFALNEMHTSNSRYNAIYFSFKIFTKIPETHRYEAWKIIIDFIKTDGPFIEIKYKATMLLGSIFTFIPDAEIAQAWADIEDLLIHKDNVIVAKIIDSISEKFTFIPKDRVIPIWEILHKLVEDGNPEIRGCVAESLGKFYCDTSNNYKKVTLIDLYKLMDDTDNFVAASAKYSLGTINIFIATQSETIEQFQEHLDFAIKYFESSLGSAEFFNQARFCYPFYKAYWNIAFTDFNEIDEIEQYVFDAKSAQGDSETRKTLVKAIKSLANAVKDARKKKDFQSLKSNLDSYRKYCDSAVFLLKNTETNAPMASKILIKGLPIIDKKIKKIISEIQEEAKNICKKTKGTSKESFGQKTHELAQNLSQLNKFQIPEGLNQLVDLVEKNFCGQLTTQDKKDVCRLIQDTKVESNLGLKLEKIKSVISTIGEKLLIPTDVHLEERIKNIVKIATVQIKYQLTQTFPPTIIDEINVKKKILDYLRLANRECVDLILLPELCVKKSWIDDFKNQFPEIMIVFGSYYDENENVTSVLYNSGIVATQKKITPSAFEDPNITGLGMKSGPKIINIFWSHLGEFSILICRDFGAFHNDLRGKSSLILVPSYNPAITRFYDNAHVHVNDSPSYVIFSNTSIFGGTAIFGQINKSYFSQLIQQGYKEKDDSTYKLCSIPKNQEGMILAELDMVNKSPQVPSPMNSDEENKNVKNIRIVTI